MALPITIPNTFANATTSIPLSQLDNNFSTVVVAINGIGNGAEALANVNITGGTVANVNLSTSNVNITGGNVAVTTVDATNIEVTNIKAKDGTAAVVISDSSGNVNFDSNTLFVDATNNSVGVGIGSPSGKFHVYQSSAADCNVTLEAASAGFATSLILQGNNASGSRFNNIISRYGSTQQWAIKGSGTDSTLAFETSNVESFRIGSNQRVAFGSTDVTSSGGRVIVLPANAASSGMSIALDCTNYVDSNMQILVSGTAASTKKAQIGPTTGTPLELLTNNTARIIIDASGRITTPSQPIFSATKTGGGATSETSDAALPYTTASVNVGSHYNTSTYRFTAPVAGRYYLYHTARWENTNSSTVYWGAQLEINGNPVNRAQGNIVDVAANKYSFSIASAIFELAANDYVEASFRRDGGGTGNIYLSESNFSGFLIG